VTEAPLPVSTLAFPALLLASHMVGQEVVHIADNSFLIEEAYNQEAGVVQHISNLVRDEAGDGWV